MQSERWSRLKQIMNACLEVEPELRKGRLAELCADDPELIVEAQSLLESYSKMGDFMADSVFEHDDTQVLTGRVIGRYQLCEPIAEGGMGTVYRAVRVSDFEKQVAIKLVKRGMDTDFILRRFRYERQILAGLDHPNIARLLDGGASDDGRPYLVMEYIEGTPITAYCDQRSLPTRDRLELFRTVCSAVQYAHQNLVVHRDIKPSNILVTGDGVPKLLDFGIAKILEPDADATMTLVRLMTPECASPEQVRGQPITTATDVYALGVLLYHLVTGQQPYQFTTVTSEEIARVICDTEPRKPSALGSLSEDLDNIVLKAMNKEPARRYASAEQLSDEIGRHLSGLPVLARKDTFSYRAGKFIARHTVATAAAAMLTISLIGGIAATLWEAHVARMERARAERRFNETKQLAHSVIFDLQNKLARLPGTTAVRKELVGTALSYLDGLTREASGDFGLQQELAEAYKLIGSIQGGGNQNLGDWQGALISFEKAEGIAREIFARTKSGEARKLLVQTLCQKAQLYHGAGDEGQSERSAKEALRLAREFVRSEPGSEEGQLVLANALETLAPYSNIQDRLAYLSEASAISETLLARKPSDQERQRNVALIDKYLAGAYMLTEDSAAGAYPYLKRAGELDEQRWRQAPNDPVAKLDFAIDLSQWGGYYSATKNLRSAIEFTRRSLELRREIVAANPKDAWAQDRLSYILGALGSLQLEKSPSEALANYKEALAVGGYPDTRAALLAGSGAAYRKLGDNQAACGAYGEATKLYREILKGPLKQVHLARAAEVEQAYAVCSGGKSGVSTR